MRICLVTTDLFGVSESSDAGVAIHGLLNHLCVRNEIDILLVREPSFVDSPEFKVWKHEYKKRGIELRGLSFPRFEIENPFLFFAYSYLTYLNLRDQDYDIVLFLDRGGLGYHCCLAKNLKLSFLSTKLISIYTDTLDRIKNHGPGSNGYSDLVQLYVEKKCLQFSDSVLFPTEHAKMRVLKSLSRTTQDSPSFLYSVDLTEQAKLPNLSAAKQIQEICFIGKIDRNPETETFLNALVKLKSKNLLQGLRIALIEERGQGSENFRIDVA